ncbi:hypothetical protein [Nesterenkonia suensis]
MTTTTTSSSPDMGMLEELADEYATLAAEHETISARMEDIRKAFRSLAVGHTHDVGPLTVTVSRNARLNTRALAASYPESEAPELYSSKIDTGRVREHLDEDMLEDFTTEADPKVTIKVTGEAQGAAA